MIISYGGLRYEIDFALTDYWHDRRAYVNGSFRSGSFRTWSFRPNVLSISFGGSFPPVISSHELPCSQGELIVYPCSGVYINDDFDLFYAYVKFGRLCV